MKNLKIIRLKFTAPLHISNVRGDYDISEKTIHSDTLYSALIEAWSVIGMEKFIPTPENPAIDFSLSTLFPFTSNGAGEYTKYIYFLPRPASFKPDVDIKINKKVKKIEYFDSQLFKQLQEHGKLDIKEEQIKGNFYTQEPVEETFYYSTVISRIKVPRSQGDAQPFYTERIYFSENAGLYFFISYENDQILNAIVAALDYFKDEGIGTDRHVGNGTFTYEIDPNAEIIHFNGIDSAYSMNLSLYIPESHEELKNSIDEKSYFEILTRGGWITSYPYLTLRKKYIRAIKEGSVLKTPSGTYGKIADITPDRSQLPEDMKNIHTIFRIGKSIWVPIKNN